MGPKKMTAKRAAQALTKIALRRLEILPRAEQEDRLYRAEKRLAAARVAKKNRNR